MDTLKRVSEGILSTFGKVLRMASLPSTNTDAGVAVDGAAIITSTAALVSSVEELLGLIRAVRRDATSLALLAPLPPLLSPSFK